MYPPRTRVIFRISRNKVANDLISREGSVNTDSLVVEGGCWQAFSIDVCALKVMMNTFCHAMSHYVSSSHH